MRRCSLPVVKSQCPVDGHTERERTKIFLNDLEHSDHGVKKRIFGALRRSGIDGW